MRVASCEVVLLNAKAGDAAIFPYVVIASDRRERGNLVAWHGKQIEIAANALAMTGTF